MGAIIARYFALGDTPTEMGEDDVETLMAWIRGDDGAYRGEWKAYDETLAVRTTIREWAPVEDEKYGWKTLMEWVSNGDGTYGWKSHEKTPPAATASAPPATASAVCGDSDAVPPDAPPATTEEGRAASPKPPSNRLWAFLGIGTLICGCVAVGRLVRKRKG